MDHKKPVTASVILESRSLRAELRVTVDSDHSLFVRESLLTRLHECAEESLPVALASVAPQVLKQVIEKCQEQLLALIDRDVSSKSCPEVLLREFGLAPAMPSAIFVNNNDAGKGE